MSKGVVYILIITVGVLIGSIGFILLKKQDLLYRLQLKLDKIKKVFLYIVEWILYLCVIYFFLNFLTIYYYQNIFSISSLIFWWFLFLLLFCIFLFYLKKIKVVYIIYLSFCNSCGINFLVFCTTRFCPRRTITFSESLLCI